ncbi:putative membrane-associated kinase regulator 1 [Bidens hawaiensis]|uniref:putative membrane-associated kinase regulator 1 n=1 Tax=Bidens hawaiensis TaxID=980011 RepID=UPI00404A5C1F
MGHQHHNNNNNNNNRKPGKTQRSQTLPSSPTNSSSSSEFEFTVSLSPRKSSATNLCPADDLFYKGQLLPLHLSPRISMVRTLLLSSSSTSSSATTARHSSDSHSSFSTEGCDSSRPSSVTDDDLHLSTKLLVLNSSVRTINSTNNNQKKTSKYFTLSKFPYVFRNKTKTCTSTSAPVVTGTRVDLDINIISGSSAKRMSTTAKEMFRKYLKKARPLYEKLSNKTLQSPPATKTDVISHSFSGNLLYPRRRSCVSSCPSSMRSSPSHSGILCRNSVVRGGGMYSSNSSSMEELQSAIQGAIAHCKNSMTQNK